MCDYSLEYIASRPAAVGDELISTRFGESITRGFRAAGDPNVAVCLLPGTELAFQRDVEFDNVFGMGPKSWRHGWPASVRSTRTSRACTTTRSNSPTARWCW